MTSEAQSLTSLAVSCLAFLVSGIALGWTIYRDVLDKGRLKIQLMIGRLIPGVQGAAPVFLSSHLVAEWIAGGKAVDAGGRDQIVVTITNTGRRRIVASKLMGRQRAKNGKKLFAIGARQLPKALEEGESTTEWFDDPSMLNDDVKAIYVYDSVGRGWKVGRRNLGRTKGDRKKFMNPPNRAARG